MVYTKDIVQVILTGLFFSTIIHFNDTEAGSAIGSAIGDFFLSFSMSGVLGVVFALVLALLLKHVALQVFQLCRLLFSQELV